MTTRIARAPHAIDTDDLLRMAVDRARELGKQIRKLEAQQTRVKLVLARTMQENDAKELTLGGVPVVRFTEYTQQTVKVSDLLAQFPQAVGLVSRTPVVRVELP
jgi:adenylate kinase family enzyme